MTEVRPLSDRHHPVPPATNRYEVRVVRSTAGGDDDDSWRTIALTEEYADAAQVAAALVAAGGPWQYAEVWGPDDEAEEAGHRGVRSRFPEPSHDEAREMWLTAADSHYSEGYSDLKH